MHWHVRDSAGGVGAATGPDTYDGDDRNRPPPCGDGCPLPEYEGVPPPLKYEPIRRNQPPLCATFACGALWYGGVAMR